MVYTSSFSNEASCIPRSLIIAFWGAGIVFGMSAAHCADPTLLDLMRQISLIQSKETSVIIQLTASFAISFVGIFLCNPRLFLLAALFKAFCLSYCAVAYFTMSLPKMCVVPFATSVLLLVFWLKNFPNISDCAYRDLAVIAVLSTVMNIFTLFCLI